MGDKKQYYMNWGVVFAIYLICIFLGAQFNSLRRAFEEVANVTTALEWQIRRVECKANGMQWVPSTTEPAGYCRTSATALGAP